MGHANFHATCALTNRCCAPPCNKAATERRSEVKTRPELITNALRPAERRLMQLLVESDALKGKAGGRDPRESLHKGLEAQAIFEAVLSIASSGARPDAAALAQMLGENDRKLLFEALFDPAGEGDWSEAESCLNVLKRRRIEAELADLQKQIEAKPTIPELSRLLSRKQELRRLIAESC